jgi:DNA (cytosine-5)-methyltransferase 1
MDHMTRVEDYAHDGGELLRRVECRDGSVVESRLKCVRAGHPQVGLPLDAWYDGEWLSSSVLPARTQTRGTVSVVDVFAGCGGLTLGVAEACRALGLAMEPALAVDIDEEALNIYERNFPEAAVEVCPVEELVDPTRQGKALKRERLIAEDYSGIDLLIGGPPCQGHSNLNNHTRWADPKNELYMAMARFCELMRPKHVIIENVPGVEKDSGQVAQRTWARLKELGYSVGTGVLDASLLGTAQVRRRSVTLASRVLEPNVMEAQAAVAVDLLRPLFWAIGDLAVNEESEPFDTPSTPNRLNQSRIDYLFDRNLYNLPNSKRPDCHRLKDHSYTPMYGRLYPDKPAPTITTGFGSMGRGRFVHPTERRLLTPHEAARIQGFPDFFGFGNVARGVLHKVIGNAVPPKLGYAAGMELLR